MGTLMTGGDQLPGRSAAGSGVGEMTTGEGVSAGLVGCSEGVVGMDVGVEALASSRGWKGVGVGVASGGTVTRMSAVGVAAGVCTWAGKASHAVNRIRKSVSVKRERMLGKRDNLPMLWKTRIRAWVYHPA